MWGNTRWWTETIFALLITQDNRSSIKFKIMRGVGMGDKEIVFYG